MNKAILAAVAGAALFAPALAQQINMNGQSQTTQSQTSREPQAQSIPGSSQAMAGHAIAPQLLSSRQIRDIQQALEVRGANSIRVDGEWGPGVEAAIRNFQKAENLILQNGELDPLTLMALGLNPLSFGLSGAGETTGQAARDSTAPQDLMDERPEHPLHGGDQDQ
jgi:peptidoglycan hydrolase-like protein with peptidoglycan-binding domain